MRKISYKIKSIFNGMVISDYFTYYHLGKEKQKNLKIYLNDLEVNKTAILKENDLLTLEYEDEIDFKPLKSKLDILYEDNYLLIINKPKNLLVHPDSKDKNGTLVNMVANYYLETKQNISVRYLHRIDMDTTGLIIFAKDILTASILNHQIETHEVSREYLLLCSGKFQESKGRFEYKIAEDRHVANKKRVGKTGKVAITNYEVLEVLNKNLNLVKAKLETGRTHQIRVHFSYSGHPLVGDALYNGNTNLLDRQALHSYKVKFIHPITLKELEITAPLPNDLKKIYLKYKKK